MTHAVIRNGDGDIPSSVRLVGICVVCAAKLLADERPPPGHAARLSPVSHHICLRRDATSMVPEFAAASIRASEMLALWNVCSSKQRKSFSVRNRLRPPYTWPSEDFGCLVI